MFQTYSLRKYSQTAECGKGPELPKLLLLVSLKFCKTFLCSLHRVVLFAHNKCGSKVPDTDLEGILHCQGLLSAFSHILHTKFACIYSFDLFQLVESKICCIVVEERKFQKSAKNVFYWLLVLWIYNVMFQIVSTWTLSYISKYPFSISKEVPDHVHKPKAIYLLSLLSFPFIPHWLQSWNQWNPTKRGKLDVWINSTVRQCWMCEDIGVRRPTILWHCDIGLASHTVELILLGLAECV